MYAPSISLTDLLLGFYKDGFDIKLPTKSDMSLNKEYHPPKKNHLKLEI